MKDNNSFFFVFKNQLCTIIFSGNGCQTMEDTFVYNWGDFCNTQMIL